MTRKTSTSIISTTGYIEMTNRETQKKIVDNTKSLLTRDIVVSTTERIIERIIVSRTDEKFNHKLFKSSFSLFLLPSYWNIIVRCETVCFEQGEANESRRSFQGDVLDRYSCWIRLSHCSSDVRRGFPCYPLDLSVLLQIVIHPSTGGWEEEHFQEQNQLNRNAFCVYETQYS